MGLLLTYLSVTAAFFAVDMIWLGTMTEKLYRPVLGDILLPQPNLVAAAFFYVIYPVGLVGFAVLPAHDAGSALRAFGSGLMFGCFTYLTYDLSNQATLRNWSTTLTVADICWGSLLGGFSAWIGYLAAQRAGVQPW